MRSKSNIFSPYRYVQRFTRMISIWSAHYSYESIGGDGRGSLSQKGSVSESGAVWVCRLEDPH